MVSTSGSSGTQSGYKIRRSSQLRVNQYALESFWEPRTALRHSGLLVNSPIVLLESTHQAPPIFPVSQSIRERARPVCATPGAGLGCRAAQIFQVEFVLNLNSR